MKVLIADDSKILQERLYGLIEECEFVTGIEQAFNTIDAKDIIQKKKIDIVISDIRMPGGGGFDLLEYIRILSSGDQGDIDYKLSISAIQRKSKRTWCGIFFK
ncbi:MAG: response regulator [Melioribacteraceae bacterium]|nr:response regulator [Melioribacteraceae bacterium]